MADYDPDNVFARILRGEIPNRTVLETEHALAFHDIAPQAPVHVMVIPKGPYVDLADFAANAPAAEQAGFLAAVAEAVRLPRASRGTGFRAIANAGAPRRTRRCRTSTSTSSAAAPSARCSPGRRPEMRPPDPRRLARPRRAALPLPAAAQGITAFHTPSGNIHCIGLPDESAASWTARSSPWTPARSSRRPSDCDLDWGQPLRGRGRRAGRHGLRRRHRARPLGRGPALRLLAAVGGVTCTSRESGLECRNAEGHGFALARRGQRLF